MRFGLMPTLLGCALIGLWVSPARSIENEAPPPGENALVYIDVAGAPGDGEKSLASALSDRLLAEGLALSGTPAANAYEIQGIVKLAPAPRGKQSVRIDWTVFDPNGNQIGGLTQTKLVRKGSLDRKWGAAAAAAAEAAAADIVKLIPH